MFRLCCCAMTLRRAIIALVLLTGLVYVNCLGGAFVWDDYVHFLDSPDLMSRTVRAAFSTDYTAAAEGENRYYHYRPVTGIVYSWMARASGMQPFVMHLLSVVLHALAGITVLFLALEFMPLVPAWIVAALFVVHPLHVEAVAYMTGISEVLAGLLVLVSLYALVRAPRGPRWLAPVAYAAAAVAFLTKETAFALPLIAVLFAGWRAWPLFVIAGGAMLARFAVIGAASAAVPQRTLWRHISLIGLTALQYTKKLLWPWPVSPEYEIWNPIGMWVAFAVLCAAAAVAAWRYPRLRAPLLLIPIALAPALASSPMMPTPWLMRDRNAYVAVLGIVLLVGYAAARWRAALAGGVALVVLWGAMSVAAIGHWRDPETLWTHTLNVTPSSSRAVVALATWYYMTQRYADADRVLEHGLRYWPAHPELRQLRLLTRQALAAPSPSAARR